MCDGYLCVDENGDGVSPSLDDECVCLCSSERLGPGSSDVRRLGGVGIGARTRPRRAHRSTDAAGKLDGRERETGARAKVVHNGCNVKVDHHACMCTTTRSHEKPRWMDGWRRVSSMQLNTHQSL